MVVLNNMRKERSLIARDFFFCGKTSATCACVQYYSGTMLYDSYTPSHPPLCSDTRIEKHFLLLTNQFSDFVTLSVSMPESSKLIISSSYLFTKHILNFGLKYQNLLAGELI